MDQFPLTAGESIGYIAKHKAEQVMNESLNLQQQVRNLEQNVKELFQRVQDLESGQSD